MLLKNIPHSVAVAMISVAIVLMFLALASYIKTYITVMKNREKDSLSS